LCAQLGRVVVSVVNGFRELVSGLELQRKKAENVRELVSGLVDAYQKGYGISLKVHVLHAHFDKGKITWETTQKYEVKDLTTMSGLSRTHYEGQYNESTMVYYTRNLSRESELIYIIHLEKIFLFM